MSAQSATRPNVRPSPDADDVMLSRALRFSEWARTNIRIIIAGAVITALALAALFYFGFYQPREREARAAAAFLQLDQTVASGNVALATSDLQKYIRAHRGTVYARQAEIELAQLHLQQNQPKEAVAVLQGAVDEIDDSPVGAQAALLLGDAQAAAGDREAAIRTYLAVAEQADFEFRRVEALVSAAELRSLAGDFAGAAELYQRLVDSAEEGSADRTVFQMRMTEAQAKAQAK